MVITTVLTVAKCGIQMSFQTLSLVLIFPSTERQLQFKKNLYEIEKKCSILIHAVYPVCNLCGLFPALGVGLL